MSRLAVARASLAAREGGRRDFGALSLGDPRLDRAFPAGGLPLGCWHELAGEGLDTETAAAAAACAALFLVPLALRGMVVWVMRRDDLHAPGLAGLGFPADRLIQVKVRSEAQALGALEEALASKGVTAAVGEAAGATLAAGRRLQLACERHGASGFLLRRRPFGGGAGVAEGGAPATRWRATPAPSEPEAGLPGLGPPRWRLTLERCRGGRTGAWIVEKREMNDGPHPLRVVAELGHSELAAAQPLRLAG